MRYIRTKDGHIIDVGAFIEKEKSNKYYKEHIFEELENRDNECHIRWTAIGTKENSSKSQRGKRCEFGAYFDSPFIKQSDTIEDLCDRFVLVDRDDEGPIEQELIGKRYRAMLDEFKFRISIGSDLSKMDLYGAIWMDRGLIYVAKFDWDAQGLVLLEAHP